MVYGSRKLDSGIDVDVGYDELLDIETGHLQSFHDIESTQELDIIARI